MQLNVHVVAFDFPDGPDSIGPTMVRVGEIADAVGVSTLSLMDHYFQIGAVGPPERAMLEGYTTLGYLAARTSRVHLGLLVTGVTYRHPGLLAKIVTTLDVLSGGRAELGIGAAWFEGEHRGLGVPFPRSPSASSDWRRRSRSASRCGTRRATGRSRGATTSWRRPSVPRARSAGPILGYSSGGAGSERPSGWSPATRMPAT